MRYFFLLLLLAAQFANADAYKCKGENGKAVITASPCEPGYTGVGVSRSDSTDQHSYNQAQADLRRQKEWLAGREEAQRRDASIAHRQSSVAALPSPPVPEQSSSGSIFDKSWGCGGRSCPSTATRR